MTQANTTTASSVFYPRTDIYESATEYMLVFDVPGVAAEAVQVKHEKDTLSVSAQRGTTGIYQRTFTLPHGVESEGIRAEIKNGVLSVHVPKSSQSQPRAIMVQTLN